MSIGDARLDARTRAIVQAIASSPADSFPQQEPTIAGREAELGFVVRVDPGRRTAGGIEARDLLQKNRAPLFRKVHLTPRARKKGAGSFAASHAPRPERDAQLEIRWGAVSIARGYGVESEVAELGLNAVHVLERKAPQGEEPVEWMLFTSEKVESIEDAAAVVDHYRARWVIEEYFKALKTGCGIEKRQLTSYEGLTRAFALFLPIAWHLLSLRSLAREQPPRPAKAALDAAQLGPLKQMLRTIRYSLPSRPTVRDAMLGIAALGGHIPANGDPGWQVLGRGYMKFSDAEVGWRLARCDQS